MSKELVINIKSFNLSYGNNKLFEDFNFQVEKGKSVGIFGPTGTGKTSLLNKIIKDYITNYKIAYIFQDNQLLENLTARKNILIPLEKNIEQADLGALVQNVLELVNIGERADEKVKVLSGGEKQRVNIARAIAYIMGCPCKLLLMDEPFSAQDRMNKMNLIKLTKKICKQYKLTSVTVSHNREELEYICDYIIEL